MKKLKDFLEVYRPKSPDEQKFVDKHVVIKHKDRNGNGDDVFKATNIKTNKRKEERHGYDVGEDEKVYEDLKGDQHKIDANKNGKVDAHDFHLLRKKKKVAEEVTDPYDVAGMIKRAKAKGDPNHPAMKHVAALEGMKKSGGALSVHGDHVRSLKKALGEGVELDEASVADVAKTAHLHVRAGKHDNISTAIQAAVDTHFPASVHSSVTRKKVAAQALSKIQSANSSKMSKEEVNLEDLLDDALELLNSIDEKTLTPAEMKKREEVVKAIKRDDPKMDKSMAYAIATKTAKRVAEGTMPTADEPTDANKKMAQKVRDLLAKEKKPVKEEVEGLDEDLSKLSKVDLVNNYRKSKNALGNLGRTPYEDREDSGWDERVKHHKDVLDSHMAELKRREVKEEVEDLDELSTTTLKSYRTKARADAYDADDVDDERRYRKRAAGSNEAGKKIVRQGGKLGEQAELDESAKIAAHLIKRYGDNVRKSHVVSAANDFGVDASKLAKAVRTKLGKTSLAEDEQIDELSKDLLRKTGGRMLRKGLEGGPRADQHMKSANLASAKLYPDQYKKSPLKANVNATNEEVEELDELSAKKLTDYMDKASDARGHRNLPTKKVDNRYAGVKKASDKLATEEVEQVDEISADMADRYLKGKRERDWKRSDDGSYSVPTNARPQDTRRKNIDARGTSLAIKSIRRLRNTVAKEEVQIDELSKKTMGSYVNKAAERIGTKGVSAGLRIAADEKSSGNFKDMGKRQKGIARAVSKLTKEDIINRTIEKYVPEDVKFTPEERLLKRLEGLSESHIGIIVGLFEQLNSDNKLKMIESVETYDGINQILNFALENRGE